MFNKLKILSKMKIKNLFAVAALMLWSTSAFAADETWANTTFNYKYDTGTKKATITGFVNDLPTSAMASVTIPATLKAKDGTTSLTVTAIEDGAFKKNANIQSVTIASPTLTTITANTFQECSNLATFTVSAAAELATIEASAFKGTKISALDLSATKVTTINNLFGTVYSTDPLVNKANTSLTQVTLGKWTSIADGAFDNCTALATVNFGAPESAASIGTKAFYKTAITAVALPAKVKNIGNSAFEDCASLATLTWTPDQDASTIGVAAFKGCTALAISFAVPAKVSAIGGSAFENSGLTALTLAADSKLGTIGANFINGTAITELDFTPAKTALVTIADDAFYSATLTKVVFAVKNADNTWTENTGLATVAAGWFAHATALSEIVLPSTITTIAEGAFKVTVLESLDLSRTGITTIGNLFKAKKTAPYASLTEVKLPNNKDLVIKTGAFAYCTKLNKITFPTKWNANGKVEQNAFQGCTGITEVTFKPEDPAGFSNADPIIGAFHIGAFNDCNAVISINTTKLYATNVGDAPNNCKYVFTSTTAKEITLNGNYALLCQSHGYQVAYDDATIYSVYVDWVDGTIYMIPFMVTGGNFEVAADTPVLLKAKNAEGGKINIQINDDVLGNSWAIGTSMVRTSTVKAVADLATDDNYLNVAAIADGKFGFTSATGTTIPAKTYYVLSPKQYGAAGARIVWLDENDATAIKNIKSAKANNGAIYNLAGQKVNAAYKGVVIKDGKKYIQK
jgi:hypothetical protein